MNLRDANFEVERLNNELEFLLRDKETLELLVDPKSIDYQKIAVDGGKHCNIIEIYVLKKELPRYRDIENKIINIQNKINNLLQYIENEMKILNKYNKVEQEIIYYKDISLKKYTWNEISKLVNYSKIQCQRIYKKNNKKRCILKDDTQ